MTTEPASLTPMFQQYHRIKAEHRDAILMFRMGDFFEMFFEDAVRAASLLEITLTARGGGTDTEVPMCGVPVHAADGYIARLVAAGLKVALCDQVEDPRAAKGLVRREVVRVITPGTITDPEHLEAKENNYLACLWDDGEAIGAAYLDLSTGDFRLAELAGESRWAALADQAAGFSPREVLVPEGASWLESMPLARLAEVRIETRPGWTFEAETARRALVEQLGVVALDGFGVADRPRAVRAAGALVQYLRATQKNALAHINRLALHDASEHLLLDSATVRNLELLRSQATGRATGALIGTLDETATGMGGRLLKAWLLRPLRRREAIEARHAAVGELLERAPERERLRDLLRGVLDLERLLCRVTLGTATPRDLGGLRDSCLRLPAIAQLARGCAAARLAGIGTEFDDLADVAAALVAALVDRPPLASRESGIVRDGFHAEVDELRMLSRDAREVLARLETRERERTGIASLRVRYNRVFGYYIEVSKANLPLVPQDYLRKQTLTNAERFITPELKEYETRILSAQDRLVALEYDLFVALRESVAAAAGRVRDAAAAVAELDVLAAFAEAAARRAYVRPRLGDARRLALHDARHPVVEALSREAFVPNDLRLDGDSRQIVILTGPNMGGKSTFLRQTAIAAVLAQAGSFVPAREAEMPLFDRVFSRVGASDNLAAGQSTFLVEMQETANILHNATHDSLVLLDEIGRGTSTFDGLSLAWAVVEHLHDGEGGHPLTLFATHYHELTELAVPLQRVVNQSIAVREWNDEVVFLRRVIEGPADQSYGIQVARLAGIPRPVIERAREVLLNLEGGEFTRDGQPRIARSRDGGRRAPPGQMELFVQEDPVVKEIRDRLRRVDVDRLTPLEALNLLAELRALLEP